MDFAKNNNPETERSELTKMKPIYQLIGDCIDGEHAVKSRRTEYLPQPNPSDTSDENYIRYNDYLTRAVFYNVTGETNEGFQGQLQLKPPVIKLPPELEPIRNNADGQGLSLAQVIKDASNYIVPYGRGGWLTDFPATNGSLTKKQVNDGEFVPTVRFVQPLDIVNWEERFVGNKKIVTMVVVREWMEERAQDSLEVKHYKRYRIMVLEGENYDRAVTYLVTVNKPDNLKSSRDFEQKDFLTSKYVLTQQDGTPMNKLPFEFIGAENNDSTIDIPPLYTMATLNIAHYRNSADYEESVYITGQPTPWITGLSQSWVDEVLNKGIRLGSRSVLTLPVGADIGLLQAAANTLAEGAMINKQEQMMMAGAKLVRENSKVERKQAEIQAEGAAQTSKLSKIATNIETALMEVLKTAYSFLSSEPIEDGELVIDINKVFNIGNRTAEELRVLHDMVNAAQPGITVTEFRAQARSIGIVFQDDEVAMSEIDSMLKDRTERAIAERPPAMPVGNNQPNSNSTGNSD